MAFIGFLIFTVIMCTLLLTYTMWVDMKEARADGRTVLSLRECWTDYRKGVK